MPLYLLRDNVTGADLATVVAPTPLEAATAAGHAAEEVAELLAGQPGMLAYAVLPPDDPDQEDATSQLLLSGYLRPLP